MPLGRLTLSACLNEVDPAPVQALLVAASCSFCGVQSGRWSFVEGTGKAPPLASPPSQARACPLCHLALHLDRPRIDEEAMLIWFPSASQPVLNTLVREMHVQLWAWGESPQHDARLRESTAGSSAIYHTRRALAERSAEVLERLGTTAPSELAAALHRLSAVARKHQHALLGGLRLLPLGRFYHDGDDKYPDIVAAWARSSVTH